MGVKTNRNSPPTKQIGVKTNWPSYLHGNHIVRHSMGPKSWRYAIGQNEHEPH